MIGGMQIDDLQTFVTVAAERSFSAAAMKLHRTQPAVSQAIRRLEESVGDRLFDGSVKSIVQDKVVFSQEVNDPLSLVKQREIPKAVRSAEGRGASPGL